MMKVTRLGSVLRARSSSAARPIGTSCRDSMSVNASASVIRSPSRALSRISATPLTSRAHRVGLDEAQLGNGFELAHVARQLEERQQPGALARAEAVAQLLEVAREEAWGIAVPLARLVRESLGLGT